MSRTRPIVIALACVAATALAAAPALARATVRKVDPTFGPYLSVQEAIDFSSDGDIILVHTGTYPSFVVDAKSLTIVADTGATVLVTSGEVRGLASAQRVVVSGVDTNLAVNPFSPQSSMNFHDNAGKVVLQYGSIHGGVPAIRIQSSTDVLVTDCDVIGTGGAIAATSANVHVHDSTVVGADGAPAFVTPFGVIPGGAGSPAIAVVSGKSVVAGSIVHGGNGGAGLDDGFGGCSAAGVGGAALALSGTAPFGSVIASSLLGGTSASSVAPCTGSGGAVPGISAPPGAVLVSPERANRSLHVTTPVREGQTATVTVIGNAGDATVLLLSTQASVTLPLGLTGTLLTGAPITADSFLMLPPSGFVSFPTVIPSLPPGVGGLEVFAQIIVAGIGGHGVLGSGHEIAVIDSLL